MIGALMLVAAGVCYLLASYAREQTVGDAGAPRPPRRTSLLMWCSACLTAAAVGVSVAEMVVFVLPG